MIVSIHQPHYLPWLRYLDKLARSDIFIVLDDVEFSKNGWQNRNAIHSAAGRLLLSVPVRHKAHQSLRDVQIDGAKWRRKHWRSLEQNYSAAPYFDRYARGLQSFYEQDWERLAELNVTMLQWHVRELGLTSRVLRSSQLGVGSSSTQRLVDLVHCVGGTAYLSGEYALDAYLDAACLEQAGIRLLIHKWQCQPYPQRFKGFLPDLATVDLLFMLGAGAASYLESCSGVVEYSRA